MKHLCLSWRLPVVCGIAILAVLRFSVPTSLLAAPAPSASPSATPAPDYAAEVAKLQTADELFNYTMTVEIIKGRKMTMNYGIHIESNPLPPAEEAQSRAHMNKALADVRARLRPAIDTFLQRYPKDPRRWDVQLQRLLFFGEAEHMTDEERLTMMKTIAAAPDANADTRHHARSLLLGNEVSGIDPKKGLTPELEKTLSDFEKDFPDDEDGRQLVQLRMRQLQATAPDKLAATLESLAKSPNKFTAEFAADQLSLLTQPVELKFESATDGQPVDLSTLRGKVVLLDFWATWCGACMARMPEIQKFNDKYKDKDFQLIGISFDQDKAAMVNTTKAKNMDWPEYCDGKGWESAVGRRFNVKEIPAEWLVDKKGMAHALPYCGNLDQEIAKLIDAEP